MAWFFDRRSRRFLHKSRKEDNSDLILERLKQYLQNAEGPIVMLSGFWDDQRDAISYQELRMLVESGTLDEATLNEWQQDYSRLVAEKMPEVWGDAILAGSVSQPVMDHIASSFVFEPTRTTVLEWVRQRAALLVTSCTQEQQKAIAMLLEDQARNRYSVDELAKLIRPCIGLTKGQASAVRNFYDSLVASLTEQHPRTSPAKIHAQALDKAVKYAEQLHRQRARTIAITEMAYAYNFGADEGVRQAQDNLLLGRCVKRWNTSGDERVCKRCGDLSGKEVGMDERFFQANLPAYPEAGLLPPIHPRCACAVEYIEVEPPVFQLVTPSQENEKSPRQPPQIEDVTEEYITNAAPGIGSFKIDDGYQMKDHDDEIEIGTWIHQVFGGDLVVRAERNTEESADFLWRDRLWELKTPEKEKSISKRMQKGLSQIFNNPGGIICDIQRLEGVTVERVVQIITGRMMTSMKNPTDVMIIDGKRLIKILRYKK